MNTDRIREKFPNEHACRVFFESILWRNGRLCPHGFERTCPISGKASRPGLFESGAARGSVYSNYQNSYAQQKAVFMEMATCHVLDRKFKQSHFLHIFG